jgi:uncharacterized membrane protein
MTKTIGNPLSWTATHAADAATHVSRSVARIGGEEHLTPKVLSLSTDDIREALRKGVDDFKEARSDVMFICLLYPAIGMLLIALGLHMQLLHIIFPVAAGFALLGPFAAIGLYEVSRQREQGEAVSWLSAFNVLQSPNLGAILVLGLYLIALFLAWIIIAHWIWSLTLGPVPPESLSAFLTETFTTSAGWAMILIGTAVGFLFALIVLATSAISFPLLIDHNIGVPSAIAASYDVFRKNTRSMLLWGLVVAASLVLGSIPAFVGLIIVLPILGHATWHLYRRALTF